MTNVDLKIVPQSRICNSCEESKPLEEFHKDKTGTFGKKSRCRTCCGKINKERYPDKRRNRSSTFKRKYGVSFEEAKSVLNRQHGLCGNRACGQEISFDVFMGNDRAVIDHCHKTGKFRAILCMSCNLTLGKIEKDRNKILGLIEYLDKVNY